MCLECRGEVALSNTSYLSGDKWQLSHTKGFSLACLGFSFLFRGVQRGYPSFQRERSEIMKADELPISAEELPLAESDFRLPITAE
jgi:hypothetical protein